MMDEPLIRGHVLEHTARFFRGAYDLETAARIEGELSIDLKSTLEALAPSSWYARRYQVELLRTVALVRGGSDATYGDLLRCGAKLAEPTNDFSTLLMQMMTPSLFLKKLPRFWERDHRKSGEFELKSDDTDSRTVRIHLHNVRQYDHGAIFWMGFIQGVLSRLGTSGLVVTQKGWSWSNPGPQDVTYEVRWS